MLQRLLGEDFRGVSRVSVTNCRFEKGIAVSVTFHLPLEPSTLCHEFLGELLARFESVVLATNNCGNFIPTDISYFNIF